MRTHQKGWTKNQNFTLGMLVFGVLEFDQADKLVMSV
jgi:hypothetical protein